MWITLHAYQQPNRPNALTCNYDLLISLRCCDPAARAFRGQLQGHLGMSFEPGRLDAWLQLLRQAAPACGLAVGAAPCPKLPPHLQRLALVREEHGQRFAHRRPGGAVPGHEAQRHGHVRRQRHLQPAAAHFRGQVGAEDLAGAWRHWRAVEGRV